MRQFAHTVVQLLVLVDELVEFVIERSSAHTLRGIVQFDDYLTLFQNHRHDTLLIHEEVSHPHGVEHTAEVKLSMHDITRVDTLQLVILDSFQIQFAAIER